MTKFRSYFNRKGSFLISTALLLCGISILNAQERDPRSRTYISPTRVVWQSDAGVRLADVHPFPMVWNWCNKFERIAFG